MVIFAFKFLNPPFASEKGGRSFYAWLIDNSKINAGSVRFSMGVPIKESKTNPH